MTKKSIIISSISVLFLSGCVGGKTYLHPNYTPQKWAMDKAECNAFARGSYGYNQPYQIQDNNKQYVINSSSFSNNGVSTNYYGTIRQQPTMNQNINGIAQSIMNIRYQNNINEAFEACLFQKGWSLEGSSISRYDSEGFERGTGYNKEGYNRQGYNKEGYNKEGYNSEGFDKYGINKNTQTIYDTEGFDKEGYNKEGIHISEAFKIDRYDKEGYDKEGYNKEGYNREGYDYEGYNRQGYNKEGIHMSEIFKNKTNNETIN